jgi:hypothetical protein
VWYRPGHVGNPQYDDSDDDVDHTHTSGPIVYQKGESAGEYGTGGASHGYSPSYMDPRDAVHDQIREITNHVGTDGEPTPKYEYTLDEINELARLHKQLYPVVGDSNFRVDGRHGKTLTQAQFEAAINDALAFVQQAFSDSAYNGCERSDWRAQSEVKKAINLKLKALESSIIPEAYNQRSIAMGSLSDFFSEASTAILGCKTPADRDSEEMQRREAEYYSPEAIAQREA